MRLDGREIQAVATDVDGTLAATEEVSELCYGALRQLEQHGVRVIIITGRSESRAVATARCAGSSAPVISCNGAIITDPVTLAPLAVHYMRPEDVGEALAVARELELQTFLWGRHEIWSDRGGALTDAMAAINAQPVGVGGKPPDPTTIVKVMLAADPDRLDQLQPEIERRLPHAQRSMSTFFETSSAGTGKWPSLSLVLDHLDIAAAATLGFGDGDNDVEWLSHIGVAIAVANAGARVREVAAMTIGDHSDDAVARFLARWVSDLPVGGPS